MVICSNMKCKNIDDIEGDHCPDCGSETVESDSNLIFAKQNCPTELSNNISSSGYKSFKLDPNSPRAKAEREENRKLLYSDSMQDSEIQYKIKEDMKNLNSHEAGTKWMRIGTLLSFNSTEQMVGAGFKALMDQNKILIRQNELILRELKKSNELKSNSDSNLD